MQDPKLLAALQESRKRQAPYAGAFLLKDDLLTDASTDTEKSVSDLKGKELFNRLHEVGTLAQVSNSGASVWPVNVLEYLCQYIWSAIISNSGSIVNSISIFYVILQISSIQGDQVILIGHRRLRITEMVSRISYLTVP